MTPSQVCAVIYGESRTPRFEILVRAVAEQSVSPAAILVPASGLDIARENARSRPGVAAFEPGGGEAQLAAAVRAAASAGTRWMWLLDGRAVPARDALKDLLGAADALAASTPLLLASKVLGDDGRLHPDAIPRHEIFEKEHSVDAAERHLVQLRTAAHGSVLVATSAVGRIGAPRSDLPCGLDMPEWSARMLRRWEDTGYLVPASVAVRRDPPLAHTGRYWLGRVRFLGSRAWTPTEKLWEAFLLGEAVAGAIRAPGRQGRAGVGAPGLSPSRSPRRMIGITRGANRLNRR